MTGFLDANGDPCIEIEVSNPLGWKKKLKCVIDTGFTGFLSVPILEAFPIGLLLVGTLPVTLADGSTQYKLVCLGEAHLGSEAQVGTILIEPAGTQALLGMEFWLQFRKRLVIDPVARTVELQDSAPPAADSPARPPLPPRSCH